MKNTAFSVTVAPWKFAVKPIGIANIVAAWLAVLSAATIPMGCVAQNV